MTNRTPARSNPHRKPVRGLATVRLVAFALLGAVAAVGTFGVVSAPQSAAITTPYVVIAANDLGMHCGQSDYSEMLILPPYNTLRAQVIRRGAEPQIIRANTTVKYLVLNNTHSSDKTNFWDFSFPALGNPNPDVGVTGFGLQGTMIAEFPTDYGDYAATGIPITPIDDAGREVSYHLATVTAERAGVVVATTQAVVPVSTEMSCNLCHNTPGVSTATDILRAHDRLHNTTLEQQKPVMCASCHSDNALGAPGQPGISSLSSAMHSAHGPRMGQIQIDNTCYACHPGVRNQCQRDLHSARGMTCIDCHGGMAAVGNPARRPWIDEPTCASCHQGRRPDFEFEQPGKLFRDSFGHKGVKCISCHSSPHAVGPATTQSDNAQMILLQGTSGVLNDCTVCHINTPSDPFFHKIDD